MDVGALRQRVMAANLAVHGAPVVVHLAPPYGERYDVRGIWIPEVTQDAPVNGAFSRREPRRVLALRRSDVPTVPKGSLIVAADGGIGADRGWRVDGYEHGDAVHHRLMVILDDAVLDEVPQ